MNEEENSNKTNLFVKSILSERVILPFNVIGKNYLEIIRQKIAQQIEGKCIADGYIKINSVEILQHSSGKVDMNMVEFQVTYQCEICLPVEGMLLQCKTKTITQKAGIHAECFDENQHPVISVFILRDDNLNHPEFSNIKEPNMNITVRVVGVLFELNDATISVTADLIS
jgi:hypothetical protein